MTTTRFENNKDMENMVNIEEINYRNDHNVLALPGYNGVFEVEESVTYIASKDKLLQEPGYNYANSVEKLRELNINVDNYSSEVVNDALLGVVKLKINLIFF